MDGMADNKANFRIKNIWIKIIIITIFAVFSAEIIVFLIGALAARSSDYSPSTFHWIWEVLSLVIIIILVKKFGVKTGIFFSAIFFGVIISALIWCLIPTRLDIIKSKYYGIETRNMLDKHPEGRGDEYVYDFPLRRGFLYQANDPQLKENFEEAKAYNEHVGFRGFLFWQTGIAYGFGALTTPKFYYAPNHFYYLIKLLFTVGPVVLVECFIKGIYKYFLIFLVLQIVWFSLRKKHVWWDKD